MKKYLFSGIDNSISTDLSLAAFRLFSGLALAFGHGLGKIPPSERFINGTGELGFPFPSFFAHAAGISEFIGGLLLAFGLFTRPSALFVAITMFVAAFIKHADDSFGSAEKAYLYLGIALVYLIIGSGRYSLDNLFRRKLNI